ncbi:MAG: acetate--CoA ligase family protein [candidate division KSB1 bacterium]|nr:acetate--CoA ligase family protein [candidate division KSB1 bacterium]MDZ7366652.1 acetate--CoA ligase family protein [candidate division KSB1 bacterium]MDZ7404663.1 acetate--CoA ligase family protein [candidate division KSB1 bacterium]
MKSLDVIFKPKSVAVIGASTRPGSLGRNLFDKMLAADFNGPIYPVHPTAKFVHSVKAYPTILDVPGAVDLAVIVVPRDQVLPTVEQCAQKGVKGLIVITAGFKETGTEGAACEQALAEIIKAHNMRMVGPNCMGVMCTDPQVRLDATFAGAYPPAGKIAFASQSGALGVTILDYAGSLNLGVSMFVSLGNKADISGNDLLEYWKEDESVGVILMYLESFGNPRKFVQLAREVSRRKPIVIVKSGRTEGGARAVSSHTGAIAGADLAYDALFTQCGVLRANTIEEMFDFAMGLANQPLPRGDRIAIVTNAGGPAIMATDACENLGLRLAKFSPETQQRLRARLLPEASVANPVDLLPAANEDDYQFTLEHILQDANVDALIVISVPPISADAIKVAQRISAVAEKSDKTVLGCFMGVKGLASAAELQKQAVPAFSFPESAARALAAMVRYAQWRQRKTSDFPTFDVRREVVAEIIGGAKKSGREQLTDWEAFQILSAYGIPSVGTKICRHLDEVIEAAHQLGYPVVLKVSSPEVIHKSEIGGVQLDLRSDADLGEAYHKLIVRLQAAGIPPARVQFLVQQMVEGGREVLLGINAIPTFGAVIAFGLGGIYVEALHDLALRVSPLTAEDAEDMVQSLRGLAILQGVRGEKPVAFDKLYETILRISQLAQDFPEIVEMDINPFLLFHEAEKCAAADVRIRIKAR